MKMKKMYKSLLSIVLAVAMLFTSQTFNMTVMAASAATSTDAIDVPKRQQSTQKFSLLM